MECMCGMARLERVAEIGCKNREKHISYFQVINQKCGMFKKTLCCWKVEKTVVEVAELKKSESSITLMRMGMIERKDFTETTEFRYAQWRLNGYIGERMLKTEILGRHRKTKEESCV